MKFLFAMLMMAQTPVCMDRSEVINQLANKYQEAPVGIGLSGAGVIELLTSPTKSWTIIITLPDGRSCLVASGENWEPIIPTRGKES